MRTSLKVALVRMSLVTVIFVFLSYLAWKYFPVRDFIILMLFFFVYLGSSMLDTFMVTEPATYVTDDDDRHSYLYLQLSSLLVLFYGIMDFVSFHITRIIDGALFLTIIGFVLFMAAVLIRIAALRSLGCYFNLRVARYEEHELIAGGIYKILRHPLYLSAWLTVTAFSLIFNSWGALLLVMVTVVPALRYRIKIEEEFLQKHFQGYNAYMLRTKRFIPGLW